MQNDWYEVPSDDTSDIYTQYPELAPQYLDAMRTNRIYQKQNTQLHQDIVRLEFTLCEKDSIISELRRTISQYEETVDNYRAANEDLKQQIAEQQQILDNYYAELGVVELSRDSLQHTIEGQCHEIELLHSTINELKQTIDTIRYGNEEYRFNGGT